ncbi:MAG: D-ribose ABC transporter substrate-binding protein, partial [Rhodanobacter sp.]
MTTKVRCVSNGVITMAAVAVLGFPMMALAAKQVSVTLITSTLNNPFFVSVVDGAKAEAKSEGINLDVENANNSAQTALNLTMTAVSKHPNVLIIDPVGSNSGSAMVRQANRAKIPVVAFDRAPSSGHLDSFIGYDAIAAGKAAAKALAQSLNGKGKV